MNFVDPLSGIRRLFYLVTPPESFYKEVDQVPNYVDEVRTSTVHINLYCCFTIAIEIFSLHGILT